MNAITPLTVVSANSDVTTPTVDIHDRIADAYYGKMGQQFMRDTQRRIHWICNHVQGKRILDIGCNQGIVPILLAREGLSVIGIDTSPKAIQEANQFLANEPEHIQKKVSFINADFLSYDCQNLGVDAVIMSEILEHLVQPQRFVQAAAELFSGKGQLIVTVPFGINDYIDHKQTYYLLEPLRLIDKYFDIVEVEVLGKWLGIVGRYREAPKNKETPLQITERHIEQLEKAFFNIERSYRDEFVNSKKRLDDLNQAKRNIAKQEDTLKLRLLGEEKTRQLAESAYSEAKQQLDKLETQLAAERLALQNKINELSTKENTLSTALQENEKKLVHLESEYTIATAYLDDLTLKHQVLTEKAGEQSEKLAQEHSLRVTSEQLLSQAREQLQVLHTQLDTERSQLQQEISQLKDQEENHLLIIQTAEKKIFQLEIEDNSLRSQLDELILKHRLVEALVHKLKNLALY